MPARTLGSDIIFCPLQLPGVYTSRTTESMYNNIHTTTMHTLKEYYGSAVRGGRGSQYRLEHNLDYFRTICILCLPRVADALRNRN